MIFYFNHFSLITFYHLVWLGFELFRLRVQVYSIGYSLRSCAKDMTITIVIINPKLEIRLECGWHHIQKRWAENLRILKITSVEDFRLEHAGRQLSFCHWGRELSSLPLCRVFYRCGGDKVFRVPTSEDELRSKTPRDMPNVGGVVSIVWLRKTFKNSLSPFVEESKTEVNKPFVSETT